jgi:REP element-mobilizing transposase RayT
MTWQKCRTPLGVPCGRDVTTSRIHDLVQLLNDYLDNIWRVLQILTLVRAERSYLMANTFSQIYIQTVFAVSGQLSLITSDFKEELHKYITGIVTKQGQKLIRINGMPDHLHILIGLKPAMALANLVRDIKSDSSEWVNKKKLARGKFAWQEGYGAFFLWSFAVRHNHSLHHESGKAPRTKNVPRRVPDVVAEI